jgi:hypothetical protein
LPEKGRPDDFSGAVGSFSIAASAEPRSLAVGDSLKLEVVLSGEGDLMHAALPRIERAEGVREQGWVEELRGGARVVTYDLVTLAAGPTAVPSIHFSFFDPAPPGAYRTASTEPIPLDVSGARSATPPSTPPLGTPANSSRHLWNWILAFALFVAATVARVAFVLRRKARAGEPGGVDEKIARSVARQVSARPAGELGQALCEYLASRLDCPVPAVIGPGLVERMQKAGIAAEGAEAVAALLNELVAARYGGAVASEAAERTSLAVEALEIEFRRASRRS